MIDAWWLLALASRWLHILAAMTAVGGIIFLRTALLPAARETLTDEARAKLHEAIRTRWARLVAAAILLLLASGLYNYFLVRGNFAQYDQKAPSWYEALFGMKFLLALLIFYISSALAGRSAATARLRENAPWWLTLNLVLAVAVVLISGILRGTHVAPERATEKTTQESMALGLPAS